MLSVKLLGRFEVHLEGEAVDISSRPAQSLFAYLILNAGTEFRREHLAGMLWPDSDEATARANLRQVLWRLRQSIGDDYLIASKVSIAFDPSPDHWLDASLIKSEGYEDWPLSRLIEVLSAYEGALLPGFYDDWIVQEREVLRSAFERKMNVLLARLLDEHRWADVIEWAEKWIAFLQAPEPAYRALMKACYTLGDSSGIAAAYERCVEDLAREFDVGPSEETKALFTRLTEAQPAMVSANPYRGLYSFRERDGPYFFGRETFTARLHEAVKRRPLVAICGPSGSGKSSAVFAGLLPRLRSEQWSIVAFRPDDDPFHALATGLAPVLFSDERVERDQELARGIQTEEIRITDLAARISNRNNRERRLLLLADQFEDLYSLCPDPRLQRRFLDLILEIYEAGRGQQGPRVVFLLTLRADFLGETLSYRPIADAFQDSLLTLGPMTREEARRAIELPAQVEGSSYESGLVDRILDDVGEKPGGLPLLQFALTHLWERRTQTRLTHQAYRAIGKVEGALARYAEEMYSNLREEEQALARDVFVQLVQTSHETHPIARRATKRELGEKKWHVVQELADARLVVTGRDSKQQDTVELVHEALIRGWDRFRGWVDEDRAFRNWQERLRSAIRLWKPTDQNSDDALLRGAQLAEAQAWLDERGDALSGDEREYIKASTALQVERKAKQEAARRKVFLTLSIGLAIALLLAAASGLAWLRAARNGQAAQEAYSLSLAANAQQFLESRDATTALPLALAAASVDDPPEAVLRVLREAASAPGPRRVFDAGRYSGPDSLLLPSSVAISPDGKSALVNVSDDGDLILMDLQTGEELRRFTGHSACVNEIAFSPDGKVAVSGADDGLVIIWDVESGHAIHRLSGDPWQVTSVAISPDGRMALSGGPGEGDSIMEATRSPGVLVLWDVETGEEVRRFEGGHSQVVLDAAFSPDGRYILSGSGLRKAVGLLPAESNLVLWDANSGEVVHRFEGLVENPTGVAIGPQGKFALVGSMEGELVLFDLDTGEIVYDFDGHTDWVSDVAFSPDGRMAVAGVGDGSLNIWSLESKNLVARFALHDEEVSDFAFTPNGQGLLSASYDGTFILWDVLDSAQIQSLLGHTAPINDLAYLPDREHVLSASADGELRLWNLENGEMVRVLRGHDDAVLGLAISPDGETALSGSSDGSMRLWDLTTGEELARYEGHGGAVNEVAFHPGGMTAISAAADRTLIKWNLETGEILDYFVGHGTSVDSMAISSDGRLVLSGDTEGPILWDYASGEEIRPFLELLEHQWGVDAVAFGPEGAFALTGSALYTNSARLWSTTTGELIYEFPASGPVRSVDVSPDGRWGLYADGERVSLVNLEKLEVVRSYTGYADSQINAVAFSPDGNTMVAGGQDASLVQWEVSTPGLEQLTRWVQENRYIRDLTCEERDLYRITPPCQEEFPRDGFALTEGYDEAELEEYLTTRPARVAERGENRGEIEVGNFDIWLYEGQAGEIVTLYLDADHPGVFFRMEEDRPQDILDPLLIIRNPDGSLLAINSTDATASSTLSANAALRELVFPVTGLYRIEARSVGENTAGAYSLIIETSSGDGSP